MSALMRPLPPRKRSPAVSPKQDPRFRKVEEKIQGNSRNLKKHEPAKKKAKDAQSAAVAPAKERLAGAQAKSVDAMESAKTGKPQPSGFLALLRAEIEKVMPQTLEDADNFMEGGQKEQMRSAVAGNVEEQSEQAAAGVKGAADAPPDPSRVPAQPSAPIPGEPAPAVAPVNGAEGMPKPKPDADVSFKATKDEANSRMQEAEITPTQCKKANDPRFSKVVSAKEATEKQSDQAPGAYRAAERKPLTAAANQANGESRAGLGRMRTSNAAAGRGVRTRQDAAKKRNEERRKAVSDHIEGIYLQTKTKVEAKLATLETTVLQQFDAGANAAIDQMKADSEREIEKFKDERYSGITGAGRWIADLFRPVPPEIKQILQRNRARFTQRMDALVVRIAATVDRILAEAKAEISRGQARIKAYVAGLPADLQAVGREAEGRVNEQFSALTEQVNGAANALAQKLAQRYKEAGDKADAELKKIEEANQGAFFGFVQALGEIVKLLLEFKDKLMAVLKKGLATIKLILADPIGFLGNLIAAVKGGIQAFVANIWTHLKAGFIKWLAGPLAGAGVSIPKDFSLPSIFKLVMDLLGLTYEKLRAKAVKLIGERNVKILEKLFEYVKTLITEGPAALWEKVKADLSSLKEMVIDAIQEWVVTTIVKQAVIKLVSMCNPAGAIIQALIAIYNTVMFFIEKAQQIWAFVEAIINSVHSIATGAIGSAISWIEQSLARLIPVLIGFLARLIGLGGITAKVISIIKKVQAVVDKAIDKVLAKIVGVVKKLFGKGGKEAKPKVESSAEAKAALNALGQVTARYPDGAEDTELKPVLADLRRQHPVFKALTLGEGSAGFEFNYQFNPSGKAKGPKQKKVKIKLKRPSGFRAATKSSLKALFPEEHKKSVKRPLLKASEARRHIIPSQEMLSHYESTVNAQGTVKKAKALLEKNGGTVSAETNKAVQTAAQSMLRDFFNDVENLWVGNASENSSIKDAWDFPPGWSDAKIDSHLKKIETKWKLKP